MSAAAPSMAREEGAAVILVAYHNDEDTLSCLASLTRLSHLPGRIFLVDNGSRDGMSLLAAWQRLWGAKNLPLPVHVDAAASADSFIYLPLPENPGFAAGINAAVAVLHQWDGLSWVWLLNPDTLPDPQALAALLDVAVRDPHVGVVGSTLLLPTDPPVLQVAGGSRVNPFLGTTPHILAGYSPDAAMNYDENAVNQRLNDIVGASMLVRAEVFQLVGPLDEGYFLYCEETEWCIRIRRAGYRLAWAKKSIVLHKEGGSSGARRLERPAYVDYLMLRNRLLMLRRHYPVALPLAAFSYILVALKRVLRGQSRRIPLVWRALRDGLGGKAGKPDIELLARYD